jgi:transcription elongation factor GreA
METYVFTEREYSQLLRLIAEAKKRTDQAATDGYESGAEQDGHHDESYQLSLRETALHDRRVSELEEIRNTAKVVVPTEQADRVLLGNVVDVEYKGGQRLKVIICGCSLSSTENPSYQEVSIKSPLGRALLGAREGETREFDIGTKRSSVKVLTIYPPSAA